MVEKNKAGEPSWCKIVEGKSKRWRGVNIAPFRFRWVQAVFGPSPHLWVVREDWLRVLVPRALCLFAKNPNEGPWLYWDGSQPKANPGHLLQEYSTIADGMPFVTVGNIPVRVRAYHPYDDTDPFLVEVGAVRAYHLTNKRLLLLMVSDGTHLIEDYLDVEVYNTETRKWMDGEEFVSSVEHWEYEEEVPTQDPEQPTKAAQPATNPPEPPTKVPAPPDIHMDQLRALGEQGQRTGRENALSMAAALIQHLPPVRGERSKPVGPEAVSLMQGSARQALVARQAFGVMKYQVGLHTFDGRWTDADLLQELLDGVQYAVKGRMEAEVEGDRKAEQLYKNISLALIELSNEVSAFIDSKAKGF